MDFSLSEKQLDAQKRIKALCEEHLMPMARQIDRERKVAVDFVRMMGREKLLCPPIPEKYGGGGHDTITYALVGMEVARAEAATATVMGVCCSLVSHPLLKFGTEEQKQQFLPRIASGEMLVSFALTEPNAGSDAAGIETTLEDKGDHYILNGHKQWITNGDMAEMLIVFATVDRSKELMGITPVIIEKSFEGFSTGKVEQTLGIRGCHQTELFFENVKVPKANVLGGERNIGKGFMIAMDTLDGGRIGVGAASCGIAEACLEEASKRAKSREQFGKPISKFQAIQWFIADMATKLEAARQLTMYAAWKKDQGMKCTTEAAMAKLFASEVCNEIADKNLQIHGGYGYTSEFAAERHLRDARIKEIYEGTSEIQRLVIARNILKKY